MDNGFGSNNNNNNNDRFIEVSMNLVYTTNWGHITKLKLFTIK